MNSAVLTDPKQSLAGTSIRDSVVPAKQRRTLGEAASSGRRRADSPQQRLVVPGERLEHVCRHRALYGIGRLARADHVLRYSRHCNEGAREEQTTVSGAAYLTKYGH